MPRQELPCHTEQLDSRDTGPKHKITEDMCHQLQFFNETHLTCYLVHEVLVPILMVSSLWVSRSKQGRTQ